MVFGWFRRRQPAAAPQAAPSLPAAPAPRLTAVEPPFGRPWRLQHEAAVRQALTDLADALRACREAGEPRSQALGLAAMRDALESVALASEDRALTRACQLFEQILGSRGATLPQRLEAAQLALDALTQLAVAEPAEREAKAAALGQLERAAARTLAA